MTRTGSDGLILNDVLRLRQLLEAKAAFLWSNLLLQIRMDTASVLKKSTPQPKNLHSHIWPAGSAIILLRFLFVSIKNGVPM